MRALKQACSFVGATMALTATCQEMSLPAQFHGTGRACYGDLTIERKTITWHTPFSQCGPTSYSLMGETGIAEHTRYTYLLHTSDSLCRYRVLSVTHVRGKSGKIGWEVTGYGTEVSYRADKASGYSNNTPDIISCYLVQSPAGNIGY